MCKTISYLLWGNHFACETISSICSFHFNIYAKRIHIYSLFLYLHFFNAKGLHPLEIKTRLALELYIIIIIIFILFIYFICVLFFSGWPERKRPQPILSKSKRLRPNVDLTQVALLLTPVGIAVCLCVCSWHMEHLPMEHTHSHTWPSSTSKVQVGGLSFFSFFMQTTY